mgnify:CR=1 FL=1
MRDKNLVIKLLNEFKWMSYVEAMKIVAILAEELQ